MGCVNHRCIQIELCVCIDIYVNMCVCVQICVCMYVFMCVCVFVCVLIKFQTFKQLINSIGVCVEYINIMYVNLHHLNSIKFRIEFNKQTNILELQTKYFKCFITNCFIINLSLNQFVKKQPNSKENFNLFRFLGSCYRRKWI